MSSSVSPSEDSSDSERHERRFFAEVHSLVTPPLKLPLTKSTSASDLIELYNSASDPPTEYTGLYFPPCGKILSDDTVILSLLFPCYGAVFLLANSEKVRELMDESNPISRQFVDRLVGIGRFRRFRRLAVRSCPRARWEREDEIDRRYDLDLDPEIRASGRWNTVRVAQLNVLFEIHGEERIKKSRIRHSRQQHHWLPNCRAQIIVLNEVTHRYVNSLKKLRWVKSNFSMTGDDSIQEFGNLVLSRIPIMRAESFNMKSQSRRPLLVVQLVNGMVLVVCHLKATSTEPEFEFQIRRQQVLEMARDLVSSRMEEAQTWMFIGDTNFDREDLPEFLEQELGWEDCWKKLHPKEVGYTYDPNSNPLIHKIWPIAKPFRFDRVLLARDGRYFPTEMSMFANKAIQTPDAPSFLFPSDHYGLLTVLQRKEEEEGGE